MSDAQGSSSPDILSAVTSLQSLVLSTEQVADFLDDLAKLAAQVVDPPASCGITVRHDNEPFTVAASDELAARLDEVQYGTGDGPCLQAMRTGERVIVSDLETETRWDGYPAHALALGVRSSLSMPLIVSGESIGALNLYGHEPDVFLGSRGAHPELFAAQAASALALVLRDIRQRTVSDQLEQALASRTVIDQAIGLLMGQQRCNAVVAFALLRARSQHSNRKLRDVAADIIARYSGAAPGVAPPFTRSRDSHE